MAQQPQGVQPLNLEAPPIDAKLDASQASDKSDPAELPKEEGRGGRAEDFGFTRSCGESE